MSTGPFTSMTHLLEWRDLMTNWRETEEKNVIRTMRHFILTGDDVTAARRVAEARGFLRALSSFDKFVAGRVEDELSHTPTSAIFRKESTRHGM